MTATMIDQARLVAAGWGQSSSGRWWHPDLPVVDRRRRLFTTADALSLLDADPSTRTQEPA